MRSGSDAANHLFRAFSSAKPPTVGISRLRGPIHPQDGTSIIRPECLMTDQRVR